MKISKGSSAPKVSHELLGRRSASKEIHKFDNKLRNPDVRRHSRQGVMKLPNIRDLSGLGGGAEVLGAAPDWLSMTCT
jgi:hypothetical protein